MSVENIDYRLLSELPKSETSDYWWWQGVRLLLEESLSFKESYGSLRCRGGIRNVPSVYDFQKKWNSAKQSPLLGDFQIVLATIEGNLVGLIVFSTNISAFQRFEGDAHKYEILSNNQTIISGSAFFDLGIVGRSFRHIGSGVFKGMLSYISKKIGCSFAYGLISPYNAYAQGVIQHYGAHFIPSSNNGLAHLCSMGKDFPYQKKGVQWLLFELPLEFNGKKGPSFPHKKVVSLKFERSGSAQGYKFNVFFEGGESGLDEETHGLLLDRIAGYAICTSSISDVEDGLTIPVFDYNNFRDGSLGEYDVISENVQGASYNAIADKMSVIAEKRHKLTQSYTQVLDICGGTHNKWNNLPFMNIKSYDARDGLDGCIDIHSLHNKFITDVQHADILLMQNAIARLYDYVRGPGRDYTQQEKSAFLRNVCNIRSDSGLDQHFLILESECVGAISFKEVCAQVCHFYPNAGKEWVAKWAAFWWYAISEKCFFPVLSEWRKNNLLGCFKIQDIQTVPQPDMSTNSRRTVRLYVLSRMLNLIYKVSFVEATVLRDQLSNFTPGLLSGKCYADLLKKNRDTIGNNRIVDYLRKYQRFHALQNEDTAYAFVVTDATIISTNTNSSLRDEIKALLLLVDVVYVCDGNNQEYYFSRFDSDVVGDPIVSCVSILNVNFLMLKTLLPDSVVELSEKKGVVSVTIGKYSPLLKGCSTLSANYFAESSINFNDIASIVRSLLNEINANIGKMWHDQVLMRSIKSAIGSIMSRNGSHNIGSHVLAALSHNVGTMPDDRVLYQYIQQRMDYIATATTDFPNWVQPTMLLGVLMKGFLSQRHLLDHISESEGLSAWQFQGCKLGNEAKAKQPWLQFHIRKWNNGKYIDLIEYDQEEGHNRVNLSEDVALAIPGGTVGNHAFYTIIENVIRNAAKHDWAVNVTAKDRPLPIYIDFKDSINERDVQIEIWAKVTALKVDDKTKGSLDKKGVESWIKRLDDGTDKDVSEFAQLPIHRQMQVLIERPFISNDGSLRRENWGLAEMKISAGYLNRIDVGAIGGLELEKYDPEHNCIILPIARKEGNEYYLAYRFYVPKPREVLIMVPDATNTTVVKKLENYGVYVRTQAAIRESGKENKRSLELNYRYVVVPSVSKDTFGKDIKFPFRVLSGSRLGDEHPQRLKNMIPELDSYKGIISSLKQIKTGDEKQLADKILGHIYDCWSRHLATYRQNDIGSAVGLLITPNEGNAGGGRSLISDDDVLKYVMRECFGECIRQYKKHDDQVSNKICDVFAVIEKDCYREEVDISKFHGTNNKIAALLHKWLTTALKDDDIRDNSFEITAQEMQRQLEEGYSINYQCDGSSTEAHSACDESVNNNNETAEEGLLINIDQIRAESKTTIEKRSKESALLAIGKLLKSGSIDGFIDYIVTVHEQAKQMFKQYEENIVSLPDGYMPEKGASSNSNVKEVTVNGIKVAFNHDALGGNAKWITYRRHDNTLDKGKGVVFAEPLSGTQSYLTQIMRLVSNLQAGEITATEKSLCARLLENGLMRVLVIDERVAKFVREHAAEVAKYYNSMAISVMDDNCQTTVIDAEQGPITQAASYFNEKSKATLKAYAEGKETSQNITALDFEILIIHQGILDKWFNEFKNDKEKMRKLLEGMKEMVKYVVITTGRGTPVNIPKDAHLIPFAVVEAALFRKYPEKLMLVDAVMNALPVGDVGAKGGPQ